MFFADNEVSEILIRCGLNSDFDQDDKDMIMSCLAHADGGYESIMPQVGVLMIQSMQHAIGQLDESTRNKVRELDSECDDRMEQGWVTLMVCPQEMQDTLKTLDGLGDCLLICDRNGPLLQEVTEAQCVEMMEQLRPFAKMEGEHKFMLNGIMEHLGKSYGTHFANIAKTCRRAQMGGLDGILQQLMGAIASGLGPDGPDVELINMNDMSDSQRDSLRESLGEKLDIPGDTDDKTVH